MQVRSLEWLLEFKDQASGQIKKVNETLNDSSKKFTDMGKSMTKLGKSMSKKITAPVVALGTAAIKSTADFDDGMSRVRSLTGATGKDFDRLREKAIQLGNDTAFSAQDASEGMQVLAASGMEVNDILETSSDMFSLMSAGSTDADTAASVLTNTMAQFNLTAKDSTAIVDTFAKGSAAAKLGVEDLEYIMGQAGGTLASMNMDMQQSVAAAGHLANAGMPIGQIGSALNAMGREVKANAGEFKELGINVYDSEGNLKDLGSVMDELSNKLEGVSDEQRDAMLSTVFSGQAMKAATDWIGKGTDAYAELTEEIYNSAGASEEMAAINEDNIGGAFRSLSSSIGTLMISIGDVLKEPVKKLAKWVQKITDMFNNASPETQKFVVAIAGIAAAIGPVLLIGGKFLTFLGEVPQKIEKVKKGFGLLKGLANPWVIAVIAIIGAGYLLYKNWDTIKEKATQLKDWLAEKWNQIKQVTENLKNSMSDKWNAIKDRAVELKNALAATWENIKNIIVNAWDIAKAVVAAPIVGHAKLMRAAFEKGIEVVKGLWSWIKNFLSVDAEGKVELLKDAFEKGIETVKSAWTSLKNFLKNPIQGTVNIVQNVKDKVSGFFKGDADGIHRTGLSRVPFDGYRAILHKDEEVLTADDPRNVNNAGRQAVGSIDKQPTTRVAGGGQQVAFSPTININIEGNATEQTANDIGKVVQQELNNFFKRVNLQGV